MALFLIFVSLILQAHIQPFISTKMNNMETFSLIVSNSTLFSGFLMSFQISEALKNILTIYIVFSNIFFIINFLKNIFWIYVSNYSKMIKYFCPCLLKAFVVFSKCKKNSQIKKFISI